MIAARLLVGALFAALIATAAPVPAARADVAGFETDYPALFAAHADRVQQPAPDLRVLELPGPVLVYRDTAADGTARYRAEDQSGLGASGCLLGALIDATVVVGLCPGTLTRDESARLDEMTRAMARHVAANSFPPVPVRQIDARLLAAIRARAARGTPRCPSRDSGAQDGAEALRALVGSGGVMAVKRALSRPRLPAMRPCT